MKPFNLSQHQARNAVNVRDWPYNAKGDGVTDDTAAIQAALDHLQAISGGQLYFPDGWYYVSQPLAVRGVSISIVGESRIGASIFQTAPGQAILNFTGDHGNIEKISLGYTGTPIPGANAMHIAGDYFNGRNFFVRNGWIGINIDGAAQVYLNDFAVQDYGGNGIYCHDQALDVWCDNFYLNCGLSTRGVEGGIRLYNMCEACVFSNGEVLQGKRSLAVDAASNTGGARPAYCTFSNVFFDSFDYPAFVKNAVLFSFVNCWWSGGRADFPGTQLTADQPGMALEGAGIDSFTFTGCRFFNCGSAGLYIAAGSRIIVNGCTAEGNGRIAGIGRGILVQAGVSNFSVVNCVLSNVNGTGIQEVGVQVAPGASDRYVVANNLVAGNTILGVLDGGTGVNKTIAGNW
jgi:hypothetical protein